MSRLPGVEVSADRRELLVEARRSMRTIERFCYRELSEAVDHEEVEEARAVLRLSVGLRRKLDNWRE